MAQATVDERQLKKILKEAVSEAFAENKEMLREVLADQASKLANQFLTLCVRAIDYCPPVDIEFGCCAGHYVVSKTSYRS